MGKTINGTSRNDTIIQSSISNNSSLFINTFGGNDKIKLDRTDDLGGDNSVNAGSGNDVVVNFFEGGNRILLGSGADVYVGTGFSSLNGSDVVDGGAGADRFFVSTFTSAYLGGADNDLFCSNGWQNGFDGGTGIDTISYQFRHEDSVIGSTGVTIDLANNLVQTGATRFENVFNIENAKGSLNGDIISGSAISNRLFGLDGDDDLFGQGGNDRLTGGLDNDFLTGGSGADVFVFTALADSRTFDADTIFDFSRLEGDRIDLSRIDANNGIAGNQAFQFIGASSFSGQAGELRFANGLLQVDVNGDRAADMAVNINNLASMIAADFIL